jgi:adenosylmethionine-8-amino-7-oxononanoate aminotransferase
MNDLLLTDKQNIWHPFTPLQGSDEPILISSASGVYLNTVDGRKIIDAVSSWWTNIHGHSNPYIAEAISLQAKKLEHVIFAGFTHEPAIKLSRNLLSILPGNQRKIFFSDNGSTAVEVAIKMALQFWDNQNINKKNIIAIQGAYHGDTFGAMSVGDRGIFTAPFSQLLFNTEFIDFPNKDNEEKVLNDFKTFIDTNTIAAFIFEPLLQGAAGMRTYSASVLDKLINYAQANNVLCIADEVLTGFGRTGKMFASDYLTNEPDIIAVSKGVTGGTMPLGVTACSEKISKAFMSDDLLKTLFHGHSYTANPLACAVANASFELLMLDECQDNIKRISFRHEEFKKRISHYKTLRDVRNIGTLLAIEINTGDGTSYSNEIRKKIYPHFLKKNILLRPLGNVIYVLPPYIITDDILDEIYFSIEAFIKDL